MPGYSGDKKSMQARGRRIEGQVRGIEKPAAKAANLQRPSGTGH